MRSARSAAAALRLAGGLVFAGPLLCACSAWQEPPRSGSLPEPVALDGDRLAFDQVMEPEATLLLGQSYQGHFPPLEVFSRDLSADFTAAVLRQRMDPDWHQRGWFAGATKVFETNGRTMVVVLPRRGRRFSVELPKEAEGAKGPVLIEARGDRAQLTWVDVTKTPWQAGRATLDLMREAWEAVVTAPLEETQAVDDVLANNAARLMRSGSHAVLFVYDRAAGVVRAASIPALGGTWTPWQALNEVIDIQTSPGGHLLVRSSVADRPDSVSVRRLYDGTWASATLTRVSPHAAWVSASALLLRTVSVEQGQSGALRSHDIALLNAGTLMTRAIPDVRVEGFRGGPAIDVWAALGDEVVELATTGEAQGALVARLFAGESAEPVVVPAPAAALAQLTKGWGGAIEVKSSVEICLFNGYSGDRPVRGGLCFDMRERTWRGLVGLAPPALHSEGKSCSQREPYTSDRVVLACSFSMPEHVGSQCGLLYPASQSVTGWIVGGMRGAEPAAGMAVAGSTSGE